MFQNRKIYFKSNFINSVFQNRISHGKIVYLGTFGDQACNNILLGQVVLTDEVEEK